ncbi:MAG: family 16 glycoside hydrolase [Planctomycetaceae bacterium]
MNRSHFTVTVVMCFVYAVLLADFSAEGARRRRRCCCGIPSVGCEATVDASSDATTEATTQAEESTPAPEPQAEAQVEEAADESDVVMPFDCESLEGWDGNPKFWSVEDGTITGRTTEENPTDGNTFLIWRGGEVDNFELELEYKIVGGNSGIQYRSFEVEDMPWVIGGYQGDFEAGDTYSGILYGERFRGILANRGQKTVINAEHTPEVVGIVGDSAEIQTHIKKEDWNHYHITAETYHFVHRINGVVTAECTDEDKEMRRASGLLALQLHAGPPMTVQFRNIKLKRLPANANANVYQPLKRKAKVVFVAGVASHAYGDHEHRAGCLLLQKGLNEGMPNVETTVVTDGWPEDITVFDGADAIVVYSDGGRNHPLNAHLEDVDALMKKGVGLVCIHYAVEVPKGEPGDAFLDWTGGYFETDWSVNPHWTADYAELPYHPITRGVEPFVVNDEWYYHMRFRPEMQGVEPILTAVPPEETLSRADGPHSGNPHVRAKVGQPQHMAWAYDRPDGGRGFGFTGGHFHWNWGNDDFRKLVLNAIVWSAQLEVPASGVYSKSLSLEELEANQDDPVPEDFNRERIRALLDEWQASTN